LISSAPHLLKQRPLNIVLAGDAEMRGNQAVVQEADVIKRELGISVLADRLAQFVDGEEAASISVFDTRPRRLKMPFGHNYSQIYAQCALTLWWFST
jgi:hypothetical protein